MIWSGSNTAKYIKGLQNAKLQIQPNGVDLTVHSISEFTTQGSIDLDNLNRVLPKVKELVSIKSDGFFGWKVPPGGYLLRYNETIEIPSNTIGLVFPRSTLMRLGAMIHTAVWDAGYIGQGLGLLTVFNQQSIKILENARVAQIIFLKTDPNSEQYSGIYQGEKA